MRHDQILFLSDSHRGFTGNMEWVRRELSTQSPDARLIGMFKADLKSRRSMRDAARLPYLMATSAVIVLDDFYPIIYEMPLRRGTRVVQLWHAAGAFKQVGHSRAGLPGGPTRNSPVHRCYTDAYVSSESIRGDYAEAFGIDSRNVKALGVPRTDFFFDPEMVDAARRSVRQALKVGDSDRLVLFAPTFRGNGQHTAYADVSADWTAVADELGAGWRVAVRLHPFTARNAPPLATGVLDASGFEMNDLLAATDVLVTDYSSSIFEFALLARPMVLFAPDLKEYAGARSFYREYSHYAVGPVVEDPSRLVGAIREAAVDRVARDRFLDEFCQALDGHSTERIARDILEPSRETATPPATATSPRPSVALLAAHVARIALTAASMVMSVLPRRRKVTFLTREHAHPPLDFLMLADAIRQEDADIEVKMIARMVPPGVWTKIAYGLHLLVEVYHVSTSRVLILDGYSPVASAGRHRRGLTIVQIWHALGALKKFGLSILGQGEGRDPRVARAMRMHENYDVVLASAEICRQPYAEAFGVDPSKIVVAALPRVDHLRDENARARARARFDELYPELAARRVALFAPTFRTTSSSPTIDAVELGHALHDIGYALITKFHPIVPPPEDLELRTAPGMSTQDLLLVADIFITDYSSAVFEAAVAGVPSYLLAPDLDEYTRTRDFYLAFPADLDLPLASTPMELAAQVRDGAATPARMTALARTYVESPTDRRSAPELARLVLGWCADVSSKVPSL